MSEISEAFASAFRMLWALDAELVAIVALSLRVSLSAVGWAALIGMPLGAAIALARFRGSGILVAILNAGMGLPPVVIGLVVYLLLSREGPLGWLEWLFTPRAMIATQCVLVLPIVAALTRQVVADLWEEYEEQLRSLGARRRRVWTTLLWDGRHRLATALLAGFGRAIAEVGAVIIVGGNIAHHTRVMTTAIALETSRGDLALALALGLILLAVSLAVNLAGGLAARAAESVG